jgi:hypothetical protein
VSAPVSFDHVVSSVDADPVHTAITLVDLDIVNPYFRSTDNQEFLKSIRVRLLGPVSGASNLDTPSLSPAIASAFMDADYRHKVLVDVGGDPDGARALGRFAEIIALRTYHLFYVVNTNRPQARLVQTNLSILREIEQTSHLKATGISGNTHLKEETTVEGIVAALPCLQELAEKTGLPLVCLTAPRPLATKMVEYLPNELPLYPVDIIVTLPWDTQEAKTP